jgi:nitrile hydratase subunit beta
MTNSIHDMGGMHGFGPVVAEPREPPFHEAWEGRVHALYRALSDLGLWTIDGGRAFRETLPPVDYLASSYDERWFRALERQVVAHNLVGEDEIAAGRSLRKGTPTNHKLTAADAQRAMVRGNFARPAAGPARFKPGDPVRTRNINPATHTRLPRYARGKLGAIEAVRGCHVFPDSAALGAGDDPRWLYTVVFPARELWGEAADPALTVSIEAFEPYLVAA